MLRNAFVFVLALGMLFGGIVAPARAATHAKTNTTVAARQAALVAAAKRKHRHHHKKVTAIVQVVPVVG